MANIKYKYTKETLAETVKISKSYSDVLKTLNITLAGGNFSHIKKQIEKFNIDTSHFERSLKAFLDAAAKRAIFTRKTPEEIFNFSGEYRAKGKQLTRALVESGVEYKCVDCGIKDTYNGHSINLEVDYVDENWKNNRKENLRFLCPNCHSQRTKRASGGIGYTRKS